MTVTEPGLNPALELRHDCAYQRRLREFRLDDLPDYIVARLADYAIILDEYHMSGSCPPPKYWPKVLRSAEP